MALGHAWLIGIEVGPVQSETMRRFGVEQREFVSEGGGAVCAAQEALDPSP
jgi:hypothetical protein